MTLHFPPPFHSYLTLCNTVALTHEQRFARWLASCGRSWTFSATQRKASPDSRWNDLNKRWNAVCRQGPTGPSSSLEPWDRSVPPDPDGFFHWNLVAMGFLELVMIRSSTRIQARNARLRVTPGLCSSFCLCDVQEEWPPYKSVNLCDPHLIDDELQNSWMAYFGRRAPAGLHRLHGVHCITSWRVVSIARKWQG